LLANVNGTQLYFERAGSGDPLVLVHGGAGDLRYWDGQFLELARHYDVVRYDLRGYGKSATPIEGEPYRHEDDMHALLVELDITKAHIAGYSLGCQIVVDAYTLYPEHFRSLVAVGPYVSGYSSAATDALFGGYGRCGEMFAQTGAQGAAEHFIRIPAFNPEHIASQVQSRLLEICGEYSWWWADHADPLEPVQPVAVDVVADVRVPVLIISAEFDAAACREVADLLAAALPNSKRVDISAASHFMLMEKPGEFNAVVLDFLDSQVSSGLAG
jgi:3-oxoadipate enol-lactonase